MTVVRAILVLAIAAAYFASVFRLRPPLGRGMFTTSWTSRPGWTNGLSDWLDPYFVNGLLEHWYRLTLGPLEALLVSAFFWTSPNVLSGFTGVWAQSASVFVIPPILLLAMVAAGMRHGRPRLALASLVGLLAPLLLIQDFYTAQFAQLITALLIVGSRMQARAQVRGVVRAAWGAVRATRGVCRLDIDRRTMTPFRPNKGAL